METRELSDQEVIRREKLSKYNIFERGDNNAS